MEPIKINVNIEVGLKQTTLEALAVIFNPWKGCTCGNIENDPQPETEQPQPNPEPKRKTETEEGPEPQPEAPATVEDDDLPPNDAPDPVRETPTEDDARQAVKAARGRGVPAKAIKDFMQKEFNIASSVECPAEKRQALIDGLNKLAA
jgi:hypothetical protein